MSRAIASERSCARGARARPTSARLIVAMLAMAALGCTTYVEPVQCEGETFRCGDEQDVKFCESIAVAVEGNDCAKLGIKETKPFCVVSKNGCYETHYAAKEGDCRVLDYRRVREWSECSPGTPTFSEP